MAIGQNFYNDDPYTEFGNLSRSQSIQSLNAGDRAASYADPFMWERANYQKRLRDLIANPGSQDSSPFFKYLMETQMNQVGANNAARGLSKSGRGAMALQDRAAGVATQSYFPQVAALTQLAQGGASPAAAGLSYERGVRSSQDQAQMSAAARAAGQQKPATPSYVPPMPSVPATSGGGYSGGALPYSSGTGGSGYTDANSPGYTPSSEAGTGYMMSDYGVQDLSGPGSQYYSFGGGQPTAQPAYQPAYDPYSSYGSDGDYGDYGSYSDFGGDY